MRTRRGPVLLALALVAALAGCGSGGSDRPAAAASGRSPAVEDNPAGDIPDNVAFVAYRPASGRYEIKVPEGWARTDAATAVSFTDKLNTVRVELVTAGAAPSVDSARTGEVPAIQSAAQRFSLGTVETVTRNAGTAVLVTYRADSAVDPVTGKVVADAFERYEFWRGGTEAVVTLSGPVNADNVDPWRTVSDSFRWLP
ncbi:MAG TPA: hypothetical protein VJT31_15175 [Rugosimonospora sp.]|nr:hypothetical protein [Rugosimonospora sp.]